MKVALLNEKILIQKAVVMDSVTEGKEQNCLCLKHP